ncbi:MAG: AraC family transcriptional regulator ligand-binding domain-containing protein, partial [Cyanobacteria bacterium P01_D01_bin.36]
MKSVNQKFVVDTSWQILLNDLGVAPQNLLRQANLPLDLFCQPEATLTTAQYFDFWRGLETLLFSDPAFPLRVAQAVTVEAFSPPVFACICSDNLNLSLQRLAQYKPLIGPLKLKVETTDYQTTISLGELPGQPLLPPSLVATELTFLVHLARLATRDRIIPLKVQSTTRLPGADELETFFGVSLTEGAFNGVVFSALDAQKPFLTSNAGMWSIF